MSSTVTKTRLAWAAGVIDGHGQGGLRITCPNEKTQNQTPKYYAELEIKSSNIELCEELKTIFGTGIAKVARTKRPENSREVCHWICKPLDNAAKSELFDVLEKIKPNIIIKQNEIELLMEFCKAQTKDLEREVYEKQQKFRQKRAEQP